MDSAKKLKRMAAWTITVFATVFAVTTAVIWLVYYPTAAGSVWSVIGQVLAAGWLIYLIAAVLCLAIYFVYKLYLDRKKVS